MGSSDQTRRRYFTSLAKLHKLGQRWLPASARAVTSNALLALVRPVGDERREVDRDQQQVERKNLAGATDVERAPERGRVAMIEQDAADQEPGDDEEQVHTRPERIRHRPAVRGARLEQGEGRQPVQPVKRDHHQDRDTAQSVELRDSSARNSPARVVRRRCSN